MLLCLLFAFLHQITALHSVLSQLSPVSATFCSCKSSCCFYLPLLTRGCHLVQPRKSIQQVYRKRKIKELIVLYIHENFLKFLSLPQCDVVSKLLRMTWDVFKEECFQWGIFSIGVIFLTIDACKIHLFTLNHFIFHTHHGADVIIALCWQVLGSSTNEETH